MALMPTLRPRDLVMLQRAAGNQAVRRLLEPHVSEPSAAESVDTMMPPLPPTSEAVRLRPMPGRLERFAAAVGFGSRSRAGGPVY